MKGRKESEILPNAIETLERLARQLEPSPAQRAEWFAAVNAYAEAFLDSLATRPVYVADDEGALDERTRILEAPEAVSELLDVLGHDVDKAGINPASGGHMGYIPGGGIYPSALGDFLADVSNRYAGVAFASPGAVRLERSLIQWMTDLVGYPASAGGDLTSGGSTANLGAIVAARDAMGIKARDIPDCCIYMTRQVHHCVDKALRIAGLGEAHVREVPMNSSHRMNTQELERLVEADRAAGLRPFMVVGSAGTTDTGAVDPLAEIAAVARDFELWFHVDAAYGGFFMLSDTVKEVLTGIEQSDSLVMDPHKGLFLPYGSGALLLRDVSHLARAHHYSADYMQDAKQTSGHYSPADLSAELSRPFRGLRLWFPLKLFGLEPFRAALDEKIQLARYFYEALRAEPGWELGPTPDLSVVTFRYVPAQGDQDGFNQHLLRAVHEDGRVFITSTLMEGRFTLRLAVLHFRTHRQEVDLLLSLLSEIVRNGVPDTADTGDTHE